MKKVLPFVIMMLFLLFPTTIDAAWYCEYADLAKMKNLASNINISYDYKIENNDASFTITLSNVYRDLYIYDVTNNKYYYPDADQDMTEFVISGYDDGKSYRFSVYTTLAKCEDKLVYTFYATTPKYNQYYNDPLCDGHANYNLCQRWANLSNMTYAQFQQNMQEYLESLKSDDLLEEDEDSKEIPWLLEFYLNYYMYILPSLIGILLITIYVISKKDDIKF